MQRTIMYVAVSVFVSMFCAWRCSVILNLWLQGLGGSSSVPSEEPEAEPKVTDTVGASFIEVDDEMLQALPKTEPISKFLHKLPLQ